MNGLPLSDHAVVTNDLEMLFAVAWQRLLANDETTDALSSQIEQQARTVGSDFYLAQAWLIQGVRALDASLPGHAMHYLMNALVRFRWLGKTEQEWFTLAAIAQAWHQLGDYDQMESTLVGAKNIEVLDTQTKFRWLGRVGMIG